MGELETGARLKPARPTNQIKSKQSVKVVSLLPSSPLRARSVCVCARALVKLACQQARDRDSRAPNLLIVLHVNLVGQPGICTHSDTHLAEWLDSRAIAATRPAIIRVHPKVGSETRSSDYWPPLGFHLHLQLQLQLASRLARRAGLPVRRT